MRPESVFKRPLWLVLALVVAGWLPHAHGAANPVVTLEVQLVPAGPVHARQRVDLVLELATHSYFLGGTRVAALDLPDVVAPMDQRHSSNYSRNLAGDTQAVQRWVQPWFPQHAGTLRLPALPVRVVVPGADGAAVTIAQLTPEFRVQVDLPPGIDPAVADGDWVASPSYQVSENWQPGLDGNAVTDGLAVAGGLAVGDVLRREIRQQADDVPAMMLPAPHFAEVPGMALYRQPPELTDQGSRGSYQGQRVDRVDYVLEQPGAVQLPALVFHWWDSSAGVMRRELLPALDLNVGGTAAVPAPDSGVVAPKPWRSVQPGWQQLPAMVLALAAGTLLALLVVAWSARLGQPHRATALWRGFRRACQQGDAVAAAALLYRWHDTTRQPGEPAGLRPAPANGLAPDAAAALSQLLDAAYGKTGAAGPEAVSRLRDIPGRLSGWRRHRTWPGFFPFQWSLDMPMRAQMLLLCAVLLTLSLPGAPAFAAAAGPVAHANYLGSSQCGSCHQQQLAAWLGSHHDLAMQPATDATVLGDFNNVQFEYNGATSTFLRRDGQFVVRTDNSAGELQDFVVSHTFGVSPLQQYLVPFPDGRYQALALAWDSRPAAEGGGRWFHLYPDEIVDHQDPLHWTGPYQTWNSRCADCHSTVLERNFDLASNSYATTWAEINVGCEACHGPGAGHLAAVSNAAPGTAVAGLVPLDQRGTWLQVPDQPGRSPGTAQRSNPLTAAVQVDTCAPCHALRAVIGIQEAGKPLLDSHLPNLLTSDQYFADGQIQGEDYVYGSFVQSKMAHAGVVCSNCHEPHNLELRVAGNGLCLQCHQSTRYDSKSHHQHPQASTGAECVACHMPERTYMVVDPRRDHSIRVPDPESTLSSGVPNACNGCHQAQTPEWAAQQVAGWRRHSGNVPGSGSQQPDGFALLAHSRQDVVSRRQLAADISQRPMHRATALAELQIVDAESLAVVQQGLQDDAGLVRLAAVRAMATVPPAYRARLVWPLLTDPLQAVRFEASRLLLVLPDEALPPLDAATAETLDHALQEYLAALGLTDDTAGAHMQRGILNTGRGLAGQALQDYQQALRLEPHAVPAMMNLADLYRQLGQDQQGEAMLHRALATAPEFAPAHHALGLLLVRQKNYAPALAALRQATVLAPDEPRYAWVWAVALHDRGQTDEAVGVLEQALALHPENRELRSFLGQLHRAAIEGTATAGP